MLKDLAKLYNVDPRQLDFYNLNEHWKNPEGINVP